MDKDIREAVSIADMILLQEKDRCTSSQYDLVMMLSTFKGLANQYLSTSAEFPKEKESKHKNCTYIDGDFCVDCMKTLEDDEAHPSYYNGYNQALKESKLWIIKNKNNLTNLNGFGKI